MSDDLDQQQYEMTAPAFGDEIEPDPPLILDAAEAARGKLAAIIPHRRWKFAALWQAGANASDAPGRELRPIPKGRTRAHWRMRSGEQIRIFDMEDSHLLATIRMLKRASEWRRLREISSIDRYIDDHAGSHAADAAEEASRDIIESDDPADYYPIYRALHQEAQARRLPVEYGAADIYFSERNEN